MRWTGRAPAPTALRIGWASKDTGARRMRDIFDPGASGSSPHSPDDALSSRSPHARFRYRHQHLILDRARRRWRTRRVNRNDEVLKLDFDRRLMLQFRGSVVTSDAGLLAYRELDDALGLSAMAGETLADARTGKNGRHALVGLLRQSVFGRLAGYEDVNDAERLRHDPAMRWIVGGKAAQGSAASPSQMGRFETQWLAAPANFSALTDLSGQWIDLVHGRRPPRGIVLDMDLSVSPTHGEQEMSVWNGHYACTCYHPLFVFNQFGDLERSALRPGNVHSADGWDGVLKPVVTRYQGKVSRICRLLQWTRLVRSVAAPAPRGVSRCPAGPGRPMGRSLDDLLTLRARQGDRAGPRRRGIADVRRRPRDLRRRPAARAARAAYLDRGRRPHDAAHPPRAAHPRPPDRDRALSAVEWNCVHTMTAGPALRAGLRRSVIMSSTPTAVGFRRGSDANQDHSKPAARNRGNLTQKLVKDAFGKNPD